MAGVNPTHRVMRVGHRGERKSKVGAANANDDSFEKTMQ